MSWFSSMHKMAGAVPAIFFSFALSLFAQTWTAIGPDGGDARSLAYDPADSARIYLGTSSSQLYVSENGGGDWRRLAVLGQGMDYVLDHIVFDPSHPGTIYVSAWTYDHEGGALFLSKDRGATWESIAAMAGKSIRALAIAPSDPNTLVAGALDGVFRSRDAGRTWTQISPPHHAEIRNVESIAIDPKNPEIIYAGTWHLPWKTEDGGVTWHNIKQGVIDDSDVFSINVDPKDPSVVFASACSGIYKSENAGELFHKIPGIPYSARRTRTLQRDPSAENIVYAGTTEGLWKTTDAGKTWKRTTGTNVIVNDVYVDPTDSTHVLLATDRGGVLASRDGGATFTPSNRGFVHRQVTALLASGTDANMSTDVYAGVINDKEYGGVFVSHDSGAHWTQMNAGLSGEDVFVLRRSDSGTVIAGTDRGVFQWQGAAWQDVDKLAAAARAAEAVACKNDPACQTVSQSATAVAPPSGKGARGSAEKARAKLTGRVNDLYVEGEKWYAATAQGLFTSVNQGASWEQVSGLGEAEFISLSVSPEIVGVAARKSLLISVDHGNSWADIGLPPSVSTISQILITPEGRLWVASSEGLYRSPNAGDSWEYLWTLPISNLAGITYDRETRRVLVTSNISTDLYSSADGRRWQRENVGWRIRHLQEVHGRLLATTPFDGVIIEPEQRASSR